MKNNYEKREKVCVCADDNETYRNTIHAKKMYKREKKKIKTEQRGFFVRTEFREWKTQQNIERERERVYKKSKKNISDDCFS